MTKTIQDLATRVLQELQIVSATEEPTAHDAAFVREEYLAAVQELEYVGAAAWAEDAIPDVVFRPLARYLASRLAAPYGSSYALGEGVAEMALRRVTAIPSSGRDAQMEPI